MNRLLASGALTGSLLLAGAGLAPSASASQICSVDITEGCVSFQSTRADVNNAAYVTRAIARTTLTATIALLEQEPLLPPNPVLPPNPIIQAFTADLFRAQVTAFARVGAVTPAGAAQLTDDINTLLPPNPI